jgi:hypothetical protein
LRWKRTSTRAPHFVYLRDTATQLLRDRADFANRLD